jgi:hypothetical protein
MPGGYAEPKWVSYHSPHSEQSHVPFIFLTGYGREVTLQEFAANPYLEKPFDSRQLPKAMPWRFENAQTTGPSAATS